MRHELGTHISEWSSLSATIEDFAIFVQHLPKYQIPIKNFTFDDSGKAKQKDLKSSLTFVKRSPYSKFLTVMNSKHAFKDLLKVFEAFIKS